MASDHLPIAGEVCGAHPGRISVEDGDGGPLVRFDGSPGFWAIPLDAVKVVGLWPRGAEPWWADLMIVLVTGDGAAYAAPILAEGADLVCGRMMEGAITSAARSSGPIDPAGTVLHPPCLAGTRLLSRAEPLAASSMGRPRPGTPSAEVLAYCSTQVDGTGRASR